MSKRILIYNDRAVGGGSETVMITVSNYLAEHGYTVIVTTDETSKKAFRQYYSPRVRYYPRSLPYRYYKKYSIRWFVQGVIRNSYEKFILPLLDHRHYHLVIAFKDGPCTIHISKLNVKRKICWVHTDYSTFHWTKAFFKSNDEERNCFEHFSRVVCVSEAGRKGVINLLGDPGNLTVCYNPIRYWEIRNKAESIVQVRRGSEPLFVSAGRLVGIKQFDLLLTACRNLQKKYRFSMWIVGGGRELDALQKRIDDEEITSVKLLGEQDNPFPYVKQADCYICCSKSECHPMAVQEALVLGVPVICTSFPAASEVVCDDYGMITENSEEGVERAMEEVILHPEKLEQWKAFLDKSFDAEEYWEPRMKRIMDVIKG